MSPSYSHSIPDSRPLATPLPARCTNYPPICNLRNSLLEENTYQGLYETFKANSNEWQSTLDRPLEGVCPCPDFEPVLCPPTITDANLDLISFMELLCRAEELLILNSILLRTPYWIRTLTWIESLDNSSAPPSMHLFLFHHHL